MRSTPTSTRSSAAPWRAAGPGWEFGRALNQGELYGVVHAGRGGRLRQDPARLRDGPRERRAAAEAGGEPHPARAGRADRLGAAPRARRSTPSCERLPPPSARARRSPRRALPAPRAPGDLPGGRLRDAVRRCARDAPRPHRRHARQPARPVRHRDIADRATLRPARRLARRRAGRVVARGPPARLVRKAPELARRRGTARGWRRPSRSHSPTCRCASRTTGRWCHALERGGAAAAAAAALRRLLRHAARGAGGARAYDRDHEAGACELQAQDQDRTQAGRGR